MLTVSSSAFVSWRDIVERIRELDSEPIPMTPGEFAKFIEVEIEKWL